MMKKILSLKIFTRMLRLVSFSSFLALLFFHNQTITSQSNFLKYFIILFGKSPNIF